MKPMLHPPDTPPWSSLTIYLLLWVISLASIGLAWFSYASTGSLPPWADKSRIIAEVGNTIVTTLLVAVTSTLRLASPETLAQVVCPCRWSAPLTLV